MHFKNKKVYENLQAGNMYPRFFDFFLNTTLTAFKRWTVLDMFDGGEIIKKIDCELNYIRLTINCDIYRIIFVFEFEVKSIIINNTSRLNLIMDTILTIRFIERDNIKAYYLLQRRDNNDLKSYCLLEYSNNLKFLRLKLLCNIFKGYDILNIEDYIKDIYCSKKEMFRKYYRGKRIGKFLSKS
ncbi:hypothetical protein ABK040_001086 [Willaertia magna]